MLDIVRKAIKEAGGPKSLARALGCTPQAFYQWDVVPRGRVLEIEEATGGKVTRHELRPDIYRPDPEQNTPGSDFVPATEAAR